jgi:hypothetical protein
MAALHECCTAFIGDEPCQARFGDDAAISRNAIDPKI